MPPLDQFEDENDRQHCRLDMDQVDETPDVVRDAARREWWRKWGGKVRRFLDEDLTEDQAEIDGLKMEIEEAEGERDALDADLIEAREEITILTKAIKEAGKILENAL